MSLASMEYVSSTTVVNSSAWRTLFPLAVLEEFALVGGNLSGRVTLQADSRTVELNLRISHFLVTE